MTAASAPKLDTLPDLIVDVSDTGATYESRMTPEAKAWANENAEFIRAHQQWIDEHGVFGEDSRTW